jgi:hypothetical protein
MTLCMAALCEDHSPVALAELGSYLGRSRVAVACDYRIEVDIASAETEVKFEKLHDHWLALMAGRVDQARELMGLYAGLFASEDVTTINSLEMLRRPPRLLRERLADTFTHTQHAMSYHEFLTNGKGQLPEDIHRQTTYAISLQQIEADLILIGYIGETTPKFRLFTCAGGEVTACSNFAVIGSGTSIASSVLYQREHISYRSVQAALYTLYEAKKLAEIAPGVGKITSYFLLGPPKEGAACVSQDWVSENGERFLNRQFRRFGPRKLDVPELPEGFFS